MDINTNDQKEHNNVAGVVIAVLLVALLGMSLFELFYRTVIPTNHDILLMVVTFLTAKVGTIVDFFYSSSSSSKQQQKTIAALAASQASGNQSSSSTDQGQ